MIKRDEIEDEGSCFNKAQDGERLFVVLARDPAAPAAVRAWIAERIRLGKNKPDDAQIRAAREDALRMEGECAEIESARLQQAFRWAGGNVAVGTAIMCDTITTGDADAGDVAEAALVVISKFSSLYDLNPSRETLAWSEFVELFLEPAVAPCTSVKCLGPSCAHKRVACWSPTVY